MHQVDFYNLIVNEIRFRVSSLTTQVIQHGIRSIQQSIDLIKAAPMRKKMMSFLVENGAKWEDMDAYNQTFEFCILVFGKQKGSGMSRQQIEF